MATPDEKFTRCPSCSTVFRVTAPQLALRDGQVRCGHCRAVFDGVAHLISLAPSVRAEPDMGHDELSAGPPTMTLRSSRALQAAPAPAPLREPSFAPEPASSVPGDTVAAPTPAKQSVRQRFTWERNKRTSTLAGRRPLVAAVALLSLLLAGQAIFHFRDAVAARWPSSKPLLTGVCEIAGCTIRPLRDVAGLAIDASDLQADPSHKGLLILTATIRNRASVPLAFPYLELTLTDSNDQVVVRRALAPLEYAGGTTDIAGGVPANGEVLVKLFIDASTTSQAGYRLYVFYP